MSLILFWNMKHVSCEPLSLVHILWWHLSLCVVCYHYYVYNHHRIHWQIILFIPYFLYILYQYFIERELGEDFDFANYNQLISKVLVNPKYNDLFGLQAWSCCLTTYWGRNNLGALGDVGCRIHTARLEYDLKKQNNVGTGQDWWD